jgi:hypothetical protein
MSDESDLRYYVILMMPVLWVIVATIVGLILYKTSSAFFAESKKSKQATRNLRLTGSVVIAAGAFLLMKFATPDELRTLTPKGTILVDQASIDVIVKRAADLENGLVRAGGCTAIEQSAPNCARDVELAKDLATALQADIERLSRR